MSNDKYPDGNPKTIYGDKKLPLHLAPMSAVHAMAEAFADGANKYGPYNWREKIVSSTVYYAAALRHLAAWFDGEEVAEDSGVPHLGHALACLAIIVDAASIGKLNDNRPPAGASARIQKSYVKVPAVVLELSEVCSAQLARDMAKPSGIVEYRKNAPVPPMFYHVPKAEEFLDSIPVEKSPVATLTDSQLLATIDRQSAREADGHPTSKRGSAQAFEGDPRCGPGA